MAKRKEFTNNQFKPFTAKTKAQKLYFNTIIEKILVFATGPAGVGKSAIAVAAAAESLYNNRIESLVLSRPAVEAGEKLGFLPGSLDEKYEEYIVPVRSILDECLGKSHVEGYLSSGRIQAVPLAFCRGRTFSNSFVILDEAQNTTPDQMKMFLTRIGEGSKMVVNGDITQKDIKGMSGLEDAIKRLDWMVEVGHVQFDRNDCVRHGIVSDILASYEDK